MEVETTPSSIFSDKAKDDLRLVERAQCGDQKAFAVLLKRYRESVFFTISRMVKNVHDAEDLTMESFGKAFRNIRYYKPVNAFSTWLFKIATNNAIDFIRSNKLHTISIDKEPEGEGENMLSPVPQLVGTDADPEENMIRDQKEQMMWQFVQHLHDDYRQITILRYFEEKSYVEIAKELDIPLGTVKARLYRSRELLLAIIKDNNFPH
ncbi:MAG: sigma-70 family RNA polymerase sigma factor [Bacteroidales bacterium]|nr:sigma-70 family RNA polymerase sigma factor [Bacteroidales bacterium]